MFLFCLMFRTTFLLFLLTHKCYFSKLKNSILVSRIFSLHNFETIIRKSNSLFVWNDWLTFQLKLQMYRIFQFTWTEENGYKIRKWHFNSPLIVNLTRQSHFCRKRLIEINLRTAGKVRFEEKKKTFAFWKWMTHFIVILATK